MTAPLVCELRYRRCGLVKRGRDVVADPEYLKTVPEKPRDFVPVVDSYGAVSRHATRLNHLQEVSGKIPFLFFPEPVAAPQRKES
jgi:hypothetical protein